MIVLRVIHMCVLSSSSLTINMEQRIVGVIQQQKTTHSNLQSIFA